MMEVTWGEAFALTDPRGHNIARVSTIETAHYWLNRRWPVADRARETALTRIEAAMECLGSVDEARRAFFDAARSAGFTPARLA